MHSCRCPSTRNVHCVIDHLSSPSFASSSGLKPSRTQALRQLSSTPNHRYNAPSIIAPVFRRRSINSPPSPTPAASHSGSSTSITTRTMSSDDAYMSFLNKANADLDNGRSQPAAQQSSAARTETVDVNVKVPTPLTSVDAYYVSDTDEPFEPVALKWEGAGKGVWPDACMSLPYPFSYTTIGKNRPAIFLWFTADIC